MIKTSRLFLFLIILAVIYILSTIYVYFTRPIQPSTWRCRGTTERDIVCEFTNFCVDKINGPFILSSEGNKPPKVNVLNVEPTEDIWFEPKVMNSVYRRAHFVNETLFVYGLYGPYHFSHFIFNGLIPLYSTIREYLPDNSAPYSLLRARTYLDRYTPLDMDVLGLPEGHDIVLNYKNVRTALQTTPPFNPICFSRAVVGTGNRCSLPYCEREIPIEDYDAFINDIKKMEVQPEDPCLNSVREYHSGSKTNIKFAILNRKQSRHITNIPDVIEAMLKEFKDVSIKLINYDEGCNIRSTAQLVEDIDVFISPHGNGLGSGLFMKKGSTVISIDSRWYSEDWFYWPMKAVNVRILYYDCNNPSCQEFDEQLLMKLAPDLTEEQKKEIMTQEVTSVDRLLVEQYRKDSKRRIDIERFIVFLKDSLPFLL